MKKQLLVLLILFSLQASAQPGEGLTKVPDFNESADGLLPTLLTNLQLQIDAVYGYRTHGLGDINGDGYDDVAVTGPGTIDVIAGPTTVASAGAVLVYFGGPGGLPSTPSRVLRSPVPLANALFGYSVAAGNVTGSSRRDIIVGAPGETYITNVAGNPATAQVTAGKVYVYDGDDVVNNNVNNGTGVFLQGSLNFSNGLGGIGANVSVNALFGFSLAVTEDMTGDNLGEIVVGAPGYADAQLILARTGAAFMIYSQNIATNVTTRLNAPSLLSFPGQVLNLNGLLFGFSVDGAGDYNKDGIADVVVGAPAGIDLGGPGFLGGSAYIFTGTGSGINTNPSTQLRPSGGLLSSIGNLFGFKVKGARNAAGNRNGNLFIGTPNANAVSNVLNGLRLKTGAIHLFAGKTNPGATETSFQTLNGPRGNSLLSILGAQNLQVSALTGADIDNLGDINCDGFGDIIVGEPLSTGVGLINTNLVGGGAYIYLGLSDGTFVSTPVWILENTVSTALGVNAASMIGYSVSGVGRIEGAGNPISALVGAPGASLDYSSGLLQLGNTIATTTGLVAGDNGLGKVYSFEVTDCSLLAINNPTTVKAPVKTLSSEELSANPSVTTGTVTINHYSALNSGQTELVVINAQGNVIMNKRLTANGGRTNVQIDLSRYPSGMYYVQARSSEYSTKTIKVIKQ